MRLRSPTAGGSCQMRVSTPLVTAYRPPVSEAGEGSAETTESALRSGKAGATAHPLIVTVGAPSRRYRTVSR